MQSQGAINGVRSRRLVLHFDVNNTILMKDTAKGLTSIQFNVARIIAKSAWGKLSPPSESDEKQVPNW